VFCSVIGQRTFESSPSRSSPGSTVTGLRQVGHGLDNNRLTVNQIRNMLASSSLSEGCCQPFTFNRDVSSTIRRRARFRKFCTMNLSHELHTHATRPR